MSYYNKKRLVRAVDSNNIRTRSTARNSTLKPAGIIIGPIHVNMRQCSFSLRVYAEMGVPYTLYPHPFAVLKDLQSQKPATPHSGNHNLD